MKALAKSMGNLIGAAGSGIGRVRRRLQKLFSSKAGSSRGFVKSSGVEFEVLEGAGAVESRDLVDASLALSMPFKGPVFIEMGQDPDAVGLELRKIGRDPLFLYDIDDTLYHPSNNLQRLERVFLTEKFMGLKNSQLSFDECLQMVNLYSAAFHAHCNLSLEEYWEMLAEFDYLRHISANPMLREFLLSMEGVRRCCFTNGSKDRAESILTKMGLLDCFEAVVCIGKLDKSFCCKPLDNSYSFVSRVLGIEVPGNVHFFDDSERNISKSRELGWNGYLVTENDCIIDVSMRALEAVQQRLVL